MQLFYVLWTDICESFTEHRGRVVLRRIWVVLASNLGLETGYLDRGSSWFSSVPPDKCRDSALNLDHNRFLPNPLHFVIHLSPFHSTLHSLRC
jgi:hypothetical protein